jgi:hypothetical protein
MQLRLSRAGLAQDGAERCGDEVVRVATDEPGADEV